jgi:hypothetical protein
MFCIFQAVDELIADGWENQGTCNLQIAGEGSRPGAKQSYDPARIQGVRLHSSWRCGMITHEPLSGPRVRSPDRLSGKGTGNYKFIDHGRGGNASHRQELDAPPLGRVMETSRSTRVHPEDELRHDEMLRRLGSMTGGLLGFLFLRQRFSPLLTKCCT